MKLTALLTLAAVALPLAAGADSIYQYRQPGGGVLFTDRATDQISRDHVLLSVRKGWQEKTGPLTAAHRDQYDGIILDVARRHDIDPALVKAVIHAESLFDRHAVSRVGAQGLMQLMPETAAFLGVANPFHARSNIDGGTRFLKYLTGKFDSTELVLAAYNAGEGNVRRHGGVPPFAETQGYVKKIADLLPRYQQHFASHSGSESFAAHTP